MATKGGGVLLLVLGAMSTGIVGCGKAHRTFNAKSDGVIVQTNVKSQNDIQKLFPTNNVTIVDPQAHLYKIQNATLKDVAEKMPTTYAEEDALINMDPSLDISNRELLSKRASIDKVIQDLSCRKLPNGPKAALDLINQPNIVAPNTVEVGSGDLIFSAEASKSSNEVASGNPIKDFFASSLQETPWDTAKKSNLTVHWVVEAPPGSKTLDESNEMKLTVSPDRTGSYVVAVIVQDSSTGACDVAGVGLGATENKKLSHSVGAKGQYSGEKFFHVPLVNGEKAWETTQGEGVTIAIVDSGANYNHPDLNPNIKINENEIPDNGIDDDHNGQIDDVYGWDFAIGDAYPYDDESHGTHVSGLAASAVSGIAKKAKILVVKVMLPSGSGTLSAIVSGIYYAIKQKVDVINLSLGGEGKASPLLIAAIKKAQEAGILMVVASGNGDERGNGINTDVVASYFTALDGSNVLAVAATDESDDLTPYSNYGMRSVDLAAPGGTRDRPLVSTYSETDLAKYIAYPGTSMASPVVAGAAALVKSVNKDLNAEQVKAILMKSGKSVSSLNGKIHSGKLLDAAAAVSEAQLLMPVLANY
jgi:subtilisin family serine protease